MNSTTAPTERDIDEIPTDNNTREQLIEDLERYKAFGTPFTGDMADHIIKLFATHYRQKFEKLLAEIHAEIAENIDYIVDVEAIEIPKVWQDKILQPVSFAQLRAKLKEKL